MIGSNVSSDVEDEELSPSLHAIRDFKPKLKAERFKWPKDMTYVSESSPPPMEVAVIYELSERIAKQSIDVGKYKSLNFKEGEIPWVNIEPRRSDSLVSDRPFTDRSNSSLMEAYARAAKKEGFMPKVGCHLFLKSL